MFEMDKIEQYALKICKGGFTGNNDRYLRLWEEVDYNSIPIKWNKYSKGGGYRRWYGNSEYVIFWENGGNELKQNPRAGMGASQYYGKPHFVWSGISTGLPSFRYDKREVFFDDVSPAIVFSQEENWKLIQLLNSKVVEKILSLIAPTIHFQAGDIKQIPVHLNVKDVDDTIGKKCIELCEMDSYSSETSWDFQHHPLLRKVPTIAEAFDQWQSECEERFKQLKTNEEELNRIFIDIYGLQDELTPEVEDKDVTVRKADLGRDIRSFISYAVGCMFGRYSLDVDGLAYAGGEWDKVNFSEGGREGTLGCASKYSSFPADKDNIIPICDDEYFEDDIVGRFVEFVRTVYGADTLDENLKFISDALGGKGQPKDVIRNYFLSDFYSDHCKIYQKRPIYWLFDSGKKNGFKALIYMHRYQPDTIARIRTDYVHEQQARYRTAIADLEQRIANASTGERVKLKKKLTTLQAQDTEIRTYEEKIHHLADQMISIDLDDGVKKNYAIFQDVLAKIK